MNQQNQGTNDSSPADPPTKRKRGRPRKDESRVRREKMPKYNSVNETPCHGANPSNADDDDMVGQVVSGVCEGSFDAGYFVTVKVGNTDTLLRGAVFVPGLFTPISAANDVAPHAKMYKRKEFPIPVLNPQAQGSGSASRLRRKNKQPVQHESTTPTTMNQVLPSDVQHQNTASTAMNQVPPPDVQHNNMTPTAMNQFLPSDVQGSTPFSIETNPPSTEVPLTYNLPQNDKVISSVDVQLVNRELNECPSVLEPKNDARISSGEKIQLDNQAPVVADQVLPSQHQTGALLALENQSASVTAPLTDYLPKNDTEFPLGGGGVPFENQVPIATDQVFQFGAPLPVTLQHTPVTVLPTFDLLKNDSVVPQGEKELPTAAAKVLFSDLQLGAAFAGENESASAVVLPADKLPRKDDGFTSEGKDMPQEIIGFGLGSQPESALTGFRNFHKIIIQDEMLQKVETSTLAKESGDDVQATKNMNLNTESMPFVDVFPGNETTIPVTQVSSAHEPKDQDLELHQAPTVADPEYFSSELISKPTDVLMEKQASTKTDFAQYIPEFTIKNLFSGNAAFQSNRSPSSSGAASIPDGAFLCSPKTSQFMINFQGESLPIELKLAADGPDPSSMFESQIPHPDNPAKDMDSGFKDAISPAKLKINPVASINPAGSEEVSQTEDDAQKDLA